MAAGPGNVALDDLQVQAFMQRMNARMDRLETDQIQRDVRGAMTAHQNTLNFRRHDQEIVALKGRRIELVANCVCAGGKIVFKLGGKEIAFLIGKQFSIEAAKRFSIIGATKVIPIVSILIGGGLAVYRFVRAYQTGDKSEIVKGIGELASGAMACFPGIGTACSIGVDLAIGGHDIYARFNPPASADVHAAIAMTLEDAYLGLNFPDFQNNLPTKEQVDAMFRAYQLVVHPDRHPGLNEEQIEQYTALSQFVTTCRDTIYVARGWNQNEGGN